MSVKLIATVIFFFVVVISEASGESYTCVCSYTTQHPNGLCKCDPPIPGIRTKRELDADPPGKQSGPLGTLADKPEDFTCKCIKDAQGKCKCAPTKLCNWMCPS